MARGTTLAMRGPMLPSARFASLVSFAVLSTGLAGCVTAEDIEASDQDVVSVEGESAATSPAEGTEDYDTMMAAVHGKLDRSLGGQPNEYTVRHLRSAEGFTFLAAIVHGGRAPLDWSKTVFQPEIESGSFQRKGKSGEAAAFSALLRRSSAGRWQMIDLIVGDKTGALAGDGYEGAPRDIFPATR